MSALVWLGLWACQSALALGQELPSGWSRRPLEGGTLYEPADLPAGSVFNLWFGPALRVGGAGGLQAFTQLERDRLRGLAPNGVQPQCDKPQPQSNGSVTQACRVDTAGHATLSVQWVMLPPVNGQARWFRVTAAGNPALLERYKSGFGAIVKLQAQAPAEATEPVAAASAARPQDRRAEVERAIHAGPGEGVKPEQIDTVLFSWAQVYRVTGLQYEETIYLLLKDGSAYRDLTLPPQDLNAEAARRLQSERWVSWRKSGGKYQVRGARDADWRTLQAWPAVPGRHDERLAQTFSHAWYASMGGLGGSAGRDSLVFRPDGRFEQIGYSSHGTGVVQASNGFAGGSVTTRDKQGTRTSVSVSATGTDQFDTPVVAGGSSSRRNDGAAQTGSYRIDGWSIELRRDNGAVERKLFLFTGDKRDAINVGGVGYSLPSKQK